MTTAQSRIGPLELRMYQRYWRAAAALRSELASIERASLQPDAVLDLPAPTVVRKHDHSTHSSDLAEFVTLGEMTRRLTNARKAPSPASAPPQWSLLSPTSPARAAAALLFARVFDAHENLLHQTQPTAPTILIDVADPHMLRQIAPVWQDVLFDDRGRLADLDKDHKQSRPELVAAYLVVTELPKGALKDRRERAALGALSMALPVIAMSPIAKSYLPDALVRAATVRIEFPRLDARTITRVIRIVTGRTCHEQIDAATAARVTLSDLTIAVRFDRPPHACLAELRRLVAAKEVLKGARELRLSDLHGLGEARAWAEAAIADIAAWQAGAIPWSQLSSGIALSGPPGCGKTTFAAVFCREAGLHMVSASLAKWQSSGEAHLGHLLRAMRQDFEEARANAPACVFIDEIDSFPHRAGLTHAWRDYVIEVVNALLAEIDGIKGREGVIVIGATNAISRCEPALLRAGRLETIVQIGLPDPTELERMFRVRLRDELANTDLAQIVELAAGLLGADIERIVKDARRAARKDGGRALALGDLRAALVRDDDSTIEQRWRTCVHEAGHLLIDVVKFGPDNVFASIARVGSHGGMSMRTVVAGFAGTLEAYRDRLQIMLAGRASEELLLGAGSHAAGGGPESDLDHATALAAAMVGSFGLTGPLTYFGARDATPALLSNMEVRAIVARELADALAAAKSSLAPRRAAVLAVAKDLFERGRVSGMEAAESLRRLSEDPVDLNSTGLAREPL